jgi:hypothetical protein
VIADRADQDEVLIHVRNALTVTSKVAGCDSCLKHTVVHRLGRVRLKVAVSPASE